MNIQDTQPVITSATVVAVITALVALLVAFGVPVTEEQKIAIIGFVAVVAPLATIFWSKRKTTTLVDPTDVDGESLTRYDGQPSIPAQRAMGLTPTPAPDRGTR